jgi:hypothetical protein
MPANIAHLLICNKAVKVLQDGGEYGEFISILDSDERKPYLNLGSIGPDLSYYGSKWEGMKSLLLILKGIKWIGPYKNAYGELKDGRVASEKFS